MADLGNQKIKDTYQSVLQTDASGNLQNLSGGTPSPFIVNGNLRYVDGSQALNYILTSDASGNATWQTPGHSTSYWSANTDGSITPSGFSTSIGVGTSTPNEKLTVVGDISATTDVHASKVITTNDVEVGGKLNLTALGTSYISLGASNKIALGTQSVLYSNWKILDGSSFAFDTQSYFTAYRDSSTSRNTLLGKSGGLDFSCTTSNTMNLYSNTVSLGNTTSETTVQDNLTVNDNLSVGDDLTVNINTLHVDSTEGTVGIGTTDQDAILTVSGSSGTSWTAWAPTGLSSIGFTNGSDFFSYADTDIIVPTALTTLGTSVRALVSGTYYYGTISAGAAVGLSNGRGYWGVTWSQPSITITDGLLLPSVISYGGLDGGGKIFKVYNGTNPAFQISGTTVMSGSTDLLDMFASSDITNQDVYWSASTGGISNSGLTGNVGIGTTTPHEKLTVVGTISGDSTIAATQYNSTSSIYGYNLNGAKVLWKEDGDIQVGNVASDTDIIGTSINLQTATTINDNLTVTGDATIPTRKYELPSSTAGDFKGGDIYYYGDGSTVKGSIYYINGTNWTLADADTVAASTTLLAVALGTDPDVDGMLLRGFVTLLTEVEGTEAIGSVLYLSATDTGIATITAPTGSGDIVRVIGYSLHATDNQVYFNPDGTWVQLT